MPSLGTEVNIDMSTSCTKDQAVMKLLGWSKDIFTSTEIQLPKEGLWLDQLPFISHHTLNLEEELKHLHERARLEYQQAFPTEAGTAEFDPEEHFGAPGVLEKIAEKQEALEDVHLLIRRARNFALDIDEELSKENSVLRKDMEATERTGVLHITLRSLEAWTAAHHSVKSIQTPVAVQAESSAFTSELEAVFTDEDAAGFSKGEKSLYVTFMNAIETLAAIKKGTCIKSDGSLNVSGLSKLLSTSTASFHNGVQIPGQDEKAITLRLNAAIKAKQKIVKKLFE
jgi:hypothetical protein